MTPDLWESDAGGQPHWVGRMEESANGAQDPGKCVVTNIIIIITIIIIEYCRKVISSVLLLKHSDSTITRKVTYVVLICRLFVRDDTLVALYQDIH